jgi:chaperonin GroES
MRGLRPHIALARFPANMQLRRNIMKIKPLHDRIVVERVAEEAKSAGGILIPDAAQEKSTQGDVVAVGPGAPLDNGEVRALTVKKGDRILFGKYAGTEVKLEGSDYVILKEEDVLAVLK